MKLVTSKFQNFKCPHLKVLSSIELKRKVCKALHKFVTNKKGFNKKRLW